MSPEILVESVACSVEDAVSAGRAGARRIELCVAIELAGLTPSIGLARETLAQCEIPIMAMVRPRGGDFTYSESEMRTMERDIETLLDAGVQGLVFGILDGERVDAKACRRLLRDRETVFHRAFDSVTDQEEALETLVDLGFTRVMTSGGKGSALEGAGRIQQLRERANGRIEVMAAGGIRSANVCEVALRTAADQVHLGPFVNGALDERELSRVVASVNSLSNPHP